MSLSNTPTGFSSLQKMGLVVLFCVLMFGTWFLAYKLNYTNEEAVFNHTTHDVTRSVDIGIEQARALLASVTALHFSLNNSDSTEISLFLDRLRRQNSFITSIGRFKIANNDTKYPLTHISPAPPRSELQAGFDLSQISSLDTLISKSIKNASVSADRLPIMWPTQGSLLFFSPSQSRIVGSATIGESSLYIDGGYLMALDLAYLLNKSSDVASGKTGYKIYLTNELGYQKIAHLEPQASDSSFFSLLNRSVSSKRKWELGGSVITVELMSSIGLSKNLRKVIMTISLLGSIFFIMFVTVLLEKKTVKEEREKNEEHLNAEREKASKTLNAISDSVVTLNIHKRILHMNPAAERLLNSTLAEVENYPIQNLFCMSSLSIGESGNTISNEIDKIQQGTEYEVDIQQNASGDVKRTLKLTMSNTFDFIGRPIGYILVLSDVTSERALTKELEYLANHDALTGCANRYYFESRLNELLNDTKISERQHAMCYIDLDQFKVVNDTCGHTAGDKLLCELTTHLQHIVRKGDLLARLGGDEFGLIIVDANVEDAKKIAEKIYDCFQTFVFQFDDNAFPVRASIGFVSIDKHSGDLTEVFAAADVALYASKDGGRNTISYYSDNNESMSSRHQEMSWLPRLNHALQHDRFRLLVQAVSPIDQTAASTHLQHFEFLVRMLDEEDKEVSPFFFIPAAERYELMANIDRWVLVNAMKIMRDLQSSTLRDCTFSINLSGQSVADPSLNEFIKSKISEYDIPPEQIWFELTETAAIKQFAIAKEFMDDMRALGCKVALDDFGSGLSSFGYLKNLPIDVLKIDGQFVKDIATNLVDLEMVRSFNNIGKAMGITTVAEFVESEDIMTVLADIGVDYAQGYHIGKPCSIDDALNSMDESRHAA